MKDMKRYAKASGRRRSGTRRARRQRQLICILACLILCLVAGYLGYRHIAKTEKPTVILPTPTPSIAVRKMDTASVEAALPYGLYTESYTSSLSEDDLWMEDFVDNRTPVNVKGVYLTADVLNKKFDEVAALLDETEVNTVVFDIKNDKGYLTVKMDSPLLKEKGETLLFMSNLPALLTKLKAHNIYCIARIVCFRDNFTPVKSPEYAVHMKNGELLKDRDGFYWLNPFKEEVWEFLTEIGIRNTNTEKRERLVTYEAESREEETRSGVAHWIETVNLGLDVANQLYDLDLRFRLRMLGTEENKREEAPDELPESD